MKKKNSQIYRKKGNKNVSAYNSMQSFNSIQGLYSICDSYQIDKSKEHFFRRSSTR